MELDVVIKGGTVVDGTGAPPFQADVGVRDGHIVELGTVDGEAHEVIDADGALVTPGWVDVHTHYDGQATWDDALEPSASNGVTTVVMGNCGVGFAPVRPGDYDTLIDIMEGVEDIPGSALSVGMPWGEWETFSEYLDVLDARRYALDVAAQVPHGAVRYYVMGERGAANEDATEEDLDAMATIVEAALAAGAVGFSTSRTIGHRAKSGRPVPGTFAPTEELLAIARAFRPGGRGVFEAIVAGTIGGLERLGGEPTKPIDELPLLEAVSRTSGRPVTFTVAQLFEDPDHWRLVLDAVTQANRDGASLRPQIIPRSVTIMTSLDAYHLFMGRPTYRALAHLPLATRVAEMRRPEVRDAILAETSGAGSPQDFSSLIVELFAIALPLTFPLSEPIDYEPEARRARLRARGGPGDRSRGPHVRPASRGQRDGLLCALRFQLRRRDAGRVPRDAAAPRLGDRSWRRGRPRHVDLGLLGEHVSSHPLGTGPLARRAAADRAPRPQAECNQRRALTGSRTGAHRARPSRRPECDRPRAVAHQAPRTSIRPPGRRGQDPPARRGLCSDPRRRCHHTTRRQGHRCAPRSACSRRGLRCDAG